MSAKHWICIGLLALTLAAMVHVCGCDFITLDDPLYVTGNAHVLAGLTWQNVHWAFTDSCAYCGFLFHDHDDVSIATDPDCGAQPIVNGGPKALIFRVGRNSKFETRNPKQVHDN